MASAPKVLEVNSKKWKDFSCKEKENYLSEHSEDCSILVSSTKDGPFTTFQGYKRIFCDVSEEFLLMFKEVGSSNEIRITDTSAELFEIVLEYLHFDKWICPSEMWKSLFVFSQKYKVIQIDEELKKAALVKKFSIDYVFAFEIAHLLNFQDEFNHRIEGRLDDKYWKRYTVPIEDFVFQSCSNEFEFGLFVKYLDIIKASVDALMCFNTVQSYIQVNSAKAENGSLSKLKVRTLLDKIDFNRMSIKEFCIGPGKSNILSPTEKYAILEGLCNKIPKEVYEKK